MSQIKIDITLVKQNNEQLLTMLSRLSNLKDNLNYIRNSIDSRITSRRDVGFRMTSTVRNMELLEYKISQIYQFVDQSSDRYKQADDFLCEASALIGVDNSSQDWLNIAKKYIGDASTTAAISFLANVLDSDKLLIIAKDLGLKFSRKQGKIVLKIVDGGGTGTPNRALDNKYKDSLKENFPDKKWGINDAYKMRNEGMVVYDKTTNRYTKNSARFMDSGFEHLNKQMKLLDNPQWKVMGKTFGSTFTDNIKIWEDVTKFKGSSTLTKLGKGFGIVGNVLSFGNNLTDQFINKDTGEWDSSDAGRKITKVGIDTAVDIGSGAAAMATGAALGTLILPPVGTVVGFAAGAALNFAMNYQFGEPPRSIVDHTKDAVNKAVDFVFDIGENIVDTVVDAVKDIGHAVKDAWDGVGDFIGDLFW